MGRGLHCPFYPLKNKTCICILQFSVLGERYISIYCSGPHTILVHRGLKPLTFQLDWKSKQRFMHFKAFASSFYFYAFGKKAVDEKNFKKDSTAFVRPVSWLKN